MSRFDWDQEKAERNYAKHGVTFNEAETIADDPFARSLRDETHSRWESRFVVMGYSARGRLLVVIVSEGGPLPRIISARRATKRERHVHEARP